MAEIGQLPGSGAPWGDIVQAKTPFTDQVTAQLLAQNAERRKYQQETTQHADELMTKELANVRSIDMNQVMDNYGKWKNISMQMLNPKVQSDPRLYNQLQQQKNAALGQTMATINKSAQLNTQAKELVGEYKAKAPLFADDFGERLTALNNTPMDQLQNHPKFGDLTNYDTFRHKGGQTNFTNLETIAAGKPQPIAGAEKVEKISDLQTRRTPTEFGSSPTQFYENLRGQFAQHIPGRDAAAAWEAVPEQQRAAVDQQFAAISPEKWLAMTGTAKPQVIAPTDPNNPAENYAAYRAKVYAINAAPRAGTPRVETNQEARMNLQAKLKLSGQEVMAAINEKNKEKLAGIQHDYKRADAKEQSRILDETMQSVIDSSKKDEEGKDKPAAYRELPSGKVAKEYKLNVGAPIQKALSIPNPDDPKHRIDADDVFYDEKNQTVTPIFYLSGKPHTLSNIDKTYSKPMTMAEFKAIYGKTYFGVKEAAKESPTQNPNTTPKTPTGASGIKWQ